MSGISLNPSPPYGHGLSLELEWDSIVLIASLPQNSLCVCLLVLGLQVGHHIHPACTWVLAIQTLSSQWSGGCFNQRAIPQQELNIS